MCFLGLMKMKGFCSVAFVGEQHRLYAFLQPTSARAAAQVIPCLISVLIDGHDEEAFTVGHVAELQNLASLSRSKASRR